MFLDCINAWAFWLALCIGMLIAYLLVPVPKVVYKYPTPENAGKVMYVDNSGVCYRYEAIPVDPPQNGSERK